jgi:predicted Rossmann-fold nucleotide-binding protein
VLTGGQTGVDTLAAVAALTAGLPVHLVFPRGFRQEDGWLTPSRRRELAGAVLHDLACDDFSDRTWACVDLSDAVILFDPAGGDGCRETAVAARDLGRPLLAPAGSGGTGPLDSAAVAAWLDRTGARVLMIAGCRGSLLAAAGRRELAAGQIAAVISVARERNDQLAT